MIVCVIDYVFPTGAAAQALLEKQKAEKAKKNGKGPEKLKGSLFPSLPSRIPGESPHF